MLVVDNSVLSAFKFLNIVQLLQNLDAQIVTSEFIFNEYTSKWKDDIKPIFSKIITPISISKIDNITNSLSKSDLHILSIAKESDALLCTDDLRLRNEAENNKIKVIGSIGLLKLLYNKKFIKSKEEYLMFLEKIQEDLYLSEEILSWAKRDL